MSLLPVAIPNGLERNGTPYDSVARWWDMNLFRFVSGSARPLGGWVKKNSAPLAEPVRRFYAWRSNAGLLITLAATASKLYFDHNGVWEDITPFDVVSPPDPGPIDPPPATTPGYGSGLYGDGLYQPPSTTTLRKKSVAPRSWRTAPSRRAAADAATPREARPYGNGLYGFGLYGLGVADPLPPGAVVPRYSVVSFANWGEDVLMVTSEDRRAFLHSGNLPGVVPALVPEIPESAAIGVTEERHVMVVAPDLPDVGYSPHSIAWSSRENMTDWDFANVSNSAGFLDLAATSPLNYICRVREGMLVFSSTEVFLVTYVGLPYVYGATKIATMEIFHPYTIAEFNLGQAFWPSNRGMNVYANGSVATINCPVFNDIRVDFSPSAGIERSHSSAYGAYPELWYFWPSYDATECDRYVIFNWVDNTWAWGYLKRTAMFPSGALLRPLAATSEPANNIYEHENGWTNDGTSILADRWLETGALGVGGGGRVIDIKQAMIATQDKFHDKPQQVKLQFYGRHTPDGVDDDPDHPTGRGERIFGPYLPRKDGYIDVRVNCREARIRIMGNIDDLFDVGLLRLDVSPGGRR